MWKKIAGGNSFKRKLMTAFLLVGLVPLILVSGLYYNLLNRQIMKDTETASIEKLRYMSMNIQRQIDKAEQLMGWLTYNKSLETILNKTYEETYERQLDIIAFSSNVSEYLINAGMEGSIFKILITGEESPRLPRQTWKGEESPRLPGQTWKGEESPRLPGQTWKGDNNFSFQMGNGYSYLREQDLIKAGWLETYQKKQADELVLSMDFYAKDTWVFPMSGRIYDSMTGRPIGWCLIVFQNNIYSEYLDGGVIAAARNGFSSSMTMDSASPIQTGSLWGRTCRRMFCWGRLWDGRNRPAT